MKNLKELEDKYIDVILNKCLNFKQNKSLLIHCDLKEHEYFAKIVEEKAKKLGVNDIKILIQDKENLHNYLKSTDINNIKIVKEIDRSDFDTYAKKKGGILFLTSEVPNLMNDIEPEKIQKVIEIMEKTGTYYREHVSKFTFTWTIVALPNKKWAYDLFGNSEDSYNKLYEYILSMCMIDKDNPIKEWDNFIEKSNYYKNKLNNLHIRRLHYTNSHGTNLTVEIPKNNKWLNTDEVDAYGNKIMPNLPSYEIFTSPDYRGTNGVVYSSKPLYYNGCCIEDFMLKFKNGEVIECNAKKGKRVLEGLIFKNKNANRLGEVALVPYDSPISNTNIVFKDTLFDENASCHLALGAGFSTTFENNENLTKEELIERGLNDSIIHIDFMIGTKDLNITAETDTKQIQIFKDGNFCI